MYEYRSIARVGESINSLCDYIEQLIPQGIQIGKVTVDVADESTLPSVEVTRGFDDIVKAWELEPREMDDTEFFNARDFGYDDMIFYRGGDND